MILCQKIIKFTIIEKGGIVHDKYRKDILCPEGHLFIESLCIMFMKHEGITNLDSFIFNLYRDQKGALINFYFEHNINSILVEYFSMIQHFFMVPLQFTHPLPSNGAFALYTAVQSSVYERLHWMKKMTKENIIQLHGYLLFPSQFSQINVPVSLFRCSDGSYIHETLVCNGIYDCSTGTDEKDCICSISLQKSVSICKHNCNGTTDKCICSDFYFQCSARSNVCIPYLFICDGYKDCPLGEDEICSSNINKDGDDSHLISNNKLFKCTMSGTVISMSSVNDLIPNCPGSFDDEVQYYNLITDPYHPCIICNSKYELPCVPGHNYCFPLSKLCIYDVQHNSLQLKYCRNGGHLHNCTDFQCPGYFKCSLSYCVPFDLVCNNIWDCPGGDDEHNCMSYSCLHLFRCKKQDKCLHMSKVCDQIKDCIYGDDELACNSESLLCPLNCTCFAHSIVCYNLMQVKYHKIYDYQRYMKCYNCRFLLSDFSFLHNLCILDVKNNCVRDICLIKDGINHAFQSLKKLDMSFNKVTTVENHYFISLRNLTILYLQNNKIVILENKAFYSLETLSILDLSNNKITKISKATFIGLDNVVVVNLTANLITSILLNAFSSLPPNTVHSLSRQVCCMSGSWLKCNVKQNIITCVMPGRIAGGRLLLEYTDETASSEAAGQCRI